MGTQGKEKEVVTFGRQYFDLERDTILRVGAEGSEPKERYSAFIEDQELLNVGTDKKKIVTGDNLLNGTIGDVLTDMIEYVKLGMDYHAAKTGSGTFNHNGWINTYTPEYGGEKLNTAYDRWLEFKADKKKKRLSITGKKQRTEPEELVMDNIGRCEIYQAGSTEPDYIVNVIDIVIEKDSSGGPNKSQIVVPSWKIETPTTEIETVDTVQYSRIERFAGKALKFLLNRE